MTLVNKNYPVFNSLSDLFNDFLSEEKQIRKPAVTVPAVNIKEREKDFVIELAVPGLNKEDINIDLDKNILTVSCAKKEEKVEEKVDYAKREFYYNEFSRSFSLPETIDSDNIKAEYTDGILYLTIAKKEEVVKQKRKIEIK